MCRHVFFEDQCSHASTALSHHNAFNTDWMMSFLFDYSDPHSVLSARSQSRLCHQYWKAGGRRGTERGKVTFSFFFIPLHFSLYLHVLVSPLGLMHHDIEMRWSHVVGSHSVTECIMLYALIHVVMPLTAYNSSSRMFFSVIQRVTSTRVSLMCLLQPLSLL